MDDDKKDQKVATNYDEKIQNLEKKLGELSQTISEQNEFIQGASVVINTVAYNPDLRDKFQETIKKQYNVVEGGEKPGEQQKQELPKNQAPQVQSPTPDPVIRKVDDVASSQRDIILSQFEREYGIAPMKDEEKKETRRKIETFLNDFGWSVTNLPLANLRQSLDKAYIGTHIDKLREEGKLEALTAMKANQQGVMSTLVGGNSQSEDEGSELSSQQREWIKKLGVSEDKAKKTYTDRDTEQSRVPASEKKAE